MNLKEEVEEVILKEEKGEILKEEVEEAKEKVEEGANRREEEKVRPL